MSAGSQDRARITSPWRAWVADYGRSTFRSSDFVLGVVAGVATFVIVLLNPEAVREVRVAAALGAAALGVALLAVVLTAMAILGGISKGYRAVLANTSRGVRGAFMPYRTVAVVSGVLVIVSLAGLLLIGLGNDWTMAGGSGLLAFLSVWATWGTVQLTAVTAWHAEQQGREEAEPTSTEIADFLRRDPRAS